MNKELYLYHINVVTPHRTTSSYKLAWVDGDNEAEAIKKLEAKKELIIDEQKKMAGTTQATIMVGYTKAEVL